MNDKLVVSDEVIDAGVRSVDSLNASLSSMTGDAHRYADVVGHKGLQHEVERSAESWRIHRSRLGETLTAVSQTLKYIQQNFHGIEVANTEAFNNGSANIGGRPPVAPMPPVNPLPGQATDGTSSSPAVTPPAAFPQPAPTGGANPPSAPPADPGSVVPHPVDPSAPDQLPPPTAEPIDDDTDDEVRVPEGEYPTPLPSIPLSPDQERVRQLLSEFLARWQELTGAPPEAMALLALAIAGAIGSGAYSVGGRGGPHHRAGEHGPRGTSDRDSPATSTIAPGTSTADVPEEAIEQFPLITSGPPDFSPVDVGQVDVSPPDLGPAAPGQPDLGPTGSDPVAPVESGPGGHGSATPPIPLEPLPRLDAPPPAAEAPPAPSFDPAPLAAPSALAGSAFPTPLEPLPDLAASPAANVDHIVEPLPPLDVAAHHGDPASGANPAVSGANGPADDHRATPMATVGGMGLRGGTQGPMASPPSGLSSAGGPPVATSAANDDRPLPSLDVMDHDEGDLDD